MSTEIDLDSPSKKPRMEIMANASSQPPTTTTPITTHAITPPLPPRTATAITPCFSNKETTTPCLEVGQKDSIIAQILAGTEADFGEGTFCSQGVFFDDSCYPSTASETPTSFSPHDTWTRDPVPQSIMMSGVKETRSLLVSMESRGCSLQHNIEQVVANHQLVTCTATEAVNLCNEQSFQLIWLQLPCPPSEDILGVITGIRYTSKLNRKTIQLGVTVTQPEIDLNLHGIDEILLEPVSKGTIRQKYFDWTSVKLAPDYELSLRDTPLSPTTPESSVSTESTIELSLSSLASDTTNDSGIHGEMDVVDLKPPTPFLFPPQQNTPTSKAPKLSARHSNGRPSTPPSWCRVEHATKEKHRRERIKDSCDQLRVLLPYVRGRKTDMASILEMTVDYLKIVNSNLPHEFHAHVLDIMTKGSDSPPARAGRTHMCGRGSRGGRGRGSRRSGASPARSVALQDTGSQGRMVTRAITRGVMASPVCTISSRGTSVGSRGGKVAKRSAHQSVVMSPGSQGVSGLYLVESKERGLVRQETVISNTMTLPTYLQPSHYTSPHLYDDTSSTSSSTSTGPTHTFPPPPLGHGSMPLTSSNDCGLTPLPRLYASAHLTVEPGFLSHSPMGNPAPLATPMRYSLSGERESGGVSALSGSYGDSVSATPAYYHYYSNVPDINPAYSVAGAGGAGACAVGAVSMCGEFMSSGALHPLPPNNTAFTSSRLQLVPSREKGEVTAQSGNLESGGDNTVYGLMDATSKTTK